MNLPQIDPELLYSAEAEQGLLGAILTDNSVLVELQLVLEDFFLPHHRNLYDIALQLDAQGSSIDPVTIHEFTRGKPELEYGTISYVTSLTQSAPCSGDAKHYARILQGHTARRKVVEAARQVLIGVRDKSAAEALENGIQVLMNLDIAQDHGGMKKLDGVLMDTWEEIEQQQQTKGNPGIDTGYIDLNNMVAMQPGDLIVVGARPSVGKTAFAMNVGENAALAGDVVGVFSLEMSDKQLARRMLSADGNIDAGRIRTGNMEADDWAKATMSIGRMHELDFFINDKPGARIGDIYRDCRKLRKMYPTRRIVILIDYLQLIVGNGKSQNRTQEVGEISRALKIIARQLDIVMICLSQLSRAVEQRQDKRPMMSDLRESGNIEQDADIIAFLYRDDYYNSESEKKNIIEIIIAKQRNGAVGTVELVFLKNYNKFVSLDRSHNEAAYGKPSNPIPDMHRKG